MKTPHIAWITLITLAAGCSSGKNPRCPVEFKPPTPAGSASGIAERWVPAPVNDFQIFHFSSLDEFKTVFRPGVPVVNLELDDIECKGGRELTDYAHAKGTKVVCYTSLGYESFRADAGEYPDDAKGADICDFDLLGFCLKSWGGEKWGDPRHPKVVDLMRARMDRCKAVGGDGIELDNMDISSNKNGLKTKINDDEVVTALTLLAGAAHERGLAFFAKNAAELSGRLSKIADGVFVEQCHSNDECTKYQPYGDEKKPVMMLEYSTSCQAFPWAACHKTSKEDYFDPK